MPTKHAKVINYHQWFDIGVSVAMTNGKGSFNLTEEQCGVTFSSEFTLQRLFGKICMPVHASAMGLGNFQLRVRDSGASTAYVITVPLIQDTMPRIVEFESKGQRKGDPGTSFGGILGDIESYAGDDMLTGPIGVTIQALLGFR